MLKEMFELTNTLAKLDRALTEDEHRYYLASLTYSATLLRASEVEIRLKELLVEKQVDELSNLDGDGT